MSQKRIAAKLSKAAIIAGVASGILYSSWPLGFVLNPVTSRTSLDSSLEAPGQPYYWVFIGLDILCGTLLLIAANLQWPRAKTSLLTRSSIIGYVLFGLTVIAAAITPYDCASVSKSCLTNTDSITTVVHGLISVGSIVVLSVSLVLATIRKFQLKRRTFGWWLIVLQVTMAILGTVAYQQISHSSLHTVSTENAYVTLSSLAIIFLVISNQ